MTRKKWTSLVDVDGYKVAIDYDLASCPICDSPLSEEFKINNEGQTAIYCTNEKCQWWLLGPFE